MAKYTMQFAEYLKDGGQLPTVFNDIDGFKDIFTAKYFDCELGFETPELFAIKLEMKANIIIPQYVKRIAYYDNALNNLSETVKKRTRVYEAGEQNAQTFTLPVNAGTVEPTQKSNTNAYTDKTEETEEGATPDEALKRLEFYETLKEGRGILIEYCLNEFKNLFMQVY